VVREGYVLLFVIAFSVLAGCGGQLTPAPDLVATEVAVREAAIATLTAHAPSPTFTGTSTATPTHTPTHTATSTPTSTPTLEPSPTRQPSSTPTSTREISIGFQGCLYECQQEPWWSRVTEEWIAGHRSFQVTLVITNLTDDKTVDPPWMPERWILTDGQSEWEETSLWEWVAHAGAPFHDKPAIGPGARVTWTFVCFPVPRGAWVKAAEMTVWERTYGVEFPNPYYGECTWYSCPVY
jgi:hypothetical protein